MRATRARNGPLLCGLLLVLGCRAQEPNLARGERSADGPAQAQATESEEPDTSVNQPFVVDEGLAQLLEQRNLEGAIAVYDTESDRWLCSHEDACDKPYQPASTFKIPHALIGLELGELVSTEHEFKWDGQQYLIAAWNQDHTLRSAMEVSCVPCFQQLARRIGEERMSEALRKLDYGNATLGAPIDVFWLEPGGLRISQRQQVTFLKRLKNQELPFSRRAMAATLDIIPKKVGSEYVLRGKTGLLGRQEQTQWDVGWYVGFLEWPGGVTYFATVLTGSQDADLFFAARREVSVAALRLVTGMSHLE